MAINQDSITSQSVLQIALSQTTSFVPLEHYIKQINDATPLDELMGFIEKVHEMIEQAKQPEISIIARCLLALRDCGQELSDDWTFDNFAIYMSRLQCICDKFEDRFPNQNVWIDYKCSNSNDDDD